MNILVRCFQNLDILTLSKSYHFENNTLQGIHCKRQKFLTNRNALLTMSSNIHDCSHNSHLRWKAVRYQMNYKSQHHRKS